MKIECLREKLGSAIAKAERVTGKNLTLPILSCVLLQAHDNTLVVRSTNLDVGLEIKIPVKIEKEGTVIVPGGVLSSFINNLKDDKSVHLEAVDGNLKVFSSTQSTIIKGQPADDFPTIPSLEKEREFEIDAKDLLKGFRAVWYSAAVSSMKPELSSVCIYGEDDAVVFVATDSFRLAEKHIKTKKAKDVGTILIPFKNVVEIIKVFEDTDGSVKVSLNKNQITFAFDGIYLISRIVEGAFPDYKQIIPKEFKTEAIVLKQDIISSLKISNIFSDKFNQINIKIHPKSKKLELKTKNNDVGETINTLQATVEGEEVDINFNYKYIMDCFQSIDVDSISLNFNGTAKPLVIRPVGDKTFTYLVMPMNR